MNKRSLILVAMPLAFAFTANVLPAEQHAQQAHFHEPAVDSDLSCTRDDLLGEWRVYRRSNNDTKSHIARGKIEIKREGSGGNVKVDKLKPGISTGVWTGACETIEGQQKYVITGTVEIQLCPHTVKIYRNDDSLENYPDECESMTEAEKKLCRAFTKLRYSKHIKIVPSGHAEVEVCPALENLHGGSAHGGSD